MPYDYKRNISIVARGLAAETTPCQRANNVEAAGGVAGSPPS